ncbi:Mu transposase C-terminal domain-containing protein [Aestuariispira insulae]|uniref:Putative transposase n=1 Tax=Aestuariispira insulae TaxID=1461337 RepID=A0A3D9H785_9PROT|nr:Mu transposase C-terminal domain-containing protein [Aestuariispira insulae]RED45021.1 putative transposase [Aestuariispira insulae]
MVVLKFEAGAAVEVNGDQCEILRIVDANNILILNRTVGEKQVVAREDVCAPSTKLKIKPHCSFTADDLEIARKRFQIIEPLISISGSIHKKVEQIAEETGLSGQTIRNWLRKYKDNPVLSALVSDRKNSQRGQRRLDDNVELIIEHHIQTKYLTKQRYKKKKLHELIVLACRTAKLTPPSYNTVDRRIALLSEEERKRKRRGPKQAKEQYKAINSEYGEAKRPLDVVQIDHTQLNIMVVDSEDREPIDRPWITVAIDVYSRMITGMFLSLDKPSADSVGMCLCQSILEKDKFLRDIGVEGDWPVWGLMKILHMDNGKDFKGEMVQIFSEEWSVDTQFRPPGFAEWGGHIERLNGTLKTELDSIPGTTFRGPKDRVEYDPDQYAVMTLDELEKYLFNHVVNVYHQKVHRQLECSPISKWNDGLTGKNGIGLPDRISDEKKLRLDLLPLSKRTIQRDGIVWDKIHYNSPELKILLENRKKYNKNQLIIRRDPRDISKIYLFHPVFNEYVQVPYRNTYRRPISLWEYKAARKRIKDRGLKTVDEDLIFRAVEENLKAIDAAKKETRSVRKKKEKSRRRKQDADRMPAGARETPKPPVRKPELKTVQPVEVKSPDPPEEDDFIDFDEDQLKPNFTILRRTL